MSVAINENAVKVLEARYLRRDDRGQIAETPEQLFRRVARGVTAAEAKYNTSDMVCRWEDTFFEMMAHLDFLPNSPTLMNAGTELAQLSACFVLPVGDSMVEIFDSLKLAAVIQQAGGGTGFSFSRLRPKGDLVSATGGTASGPLSFMRIFDSATENVRLGGRRRGANMGVLRVDHPDIMEFIEAKLPPGSGSAVMPFQNFNLSVSVTDEFMRAVQANSQFSLRHPSTGQTVRQLPAADIFRRIGEAAWESGDPGLLFIDTINRANPTPSLGVIEATNPCGEVPLLPYEACNLGSINLSHMLKQCAGESKTNSDVQRVQASRVTIDWEKLARTIGNAVRFLDDVIDVGRWPAPQIEAMVRGNRKIGLGVMGLAELLIQLHLPYASPEAVSLSEKLMEFIASQTVAASESLAAERGPFPNWEHSVYCGAAHHNPRRNATLTSIAPTGTIGIIAGTSAGIEPLFALAYRRHALDGQVLTELNPFFDRYAREHGFWSQQLAEEVKTTGTLEGSKRVPPEVQCLFRCALNIDSMDHLRMQSAFQKHVDNAVSKTVNLPRTVTVQDIGNIYWQAWEMGLKGVTVFRYGSKGQQVLELGLGETLQQYEHFARCDPHACKL